jgi:hypothetical protein
LLVGREILHSLLKGGDIQVVLDAGLGSKWLEGVNTGSEVIFTGIDKQAYQWLLSHWTRHHKIPPMEIFRENFPEETMKFGSKVISIEELTELTVEKVNSFKVAELIGRTIDLHDRGEIGKAVRLLSSESANLATGIKYRSSKADDLSSRSFDIEKLLSVELEPGIPFGVDLIDEEFYGFQPGQLISLMGRQKSGKSWSTINSAYHAWRQGYTALVFSVEMDVNVLSQRILCLGAHVSPSRMRRGKLREPEKERVRDFHQLLTEDEGRLLISKKKSFITADDIAEEIALYNPNIVYIDGFSFMVDSKTGKMTSDWQANENVAYALKSLAEEEQIAMFVNTQVREKQYSPKHGIEARTIAAGSGLLQASDLVLGQDKEDNYMTINCVYSRFEYPPTVVLEVDWDNMEFITVQEKMEAMNV